MSLFQNENITEQDTNYKSMGKSQLIMLLQSQKSDIDALERKLGKTAALEEENKRLTEQTAALGAENEALKARIAELEEQLAPKDSELTEPGSIAEMAFSVNGVMNAAQKAADDYLAKIKEMHDNMSHEYSEYETAARQKADAIMKNAVEEADAVKMKARTEANDIWNTLQKRVDNYISEKKQ